MARSKEQAVAQTEIEKQLSGVQPLLDAAKEAVGSIKAENLNEIRALKMPPEAIRDVLEAVLCVMGIFDTSWATGHSHPPIASVGVWKPEALTDPIRTAH